MATMTNERTPDNTGKELPREGDVAYFIKLHLDTVRREGPAEKPDESMYSVRGKSRPMFVVRCDTVDGRHLFQVFPLRRSGSRETVRIGCLIDPNRQSFVETRPLWLPANMAGSITKRCDRIAFNSIVSILNRVALGR